MLPFLLIFGTVMILAGIFSKQILRLLGLKPMSEVFTTPNLKHSTKLVEQIGRWLVIILGAGFLVEGLRGIVIISNDIGTQISLALFGLSALMFLAMIVITLANWKAR